MRCRVNEDERGITPANVTAITVSQVSQGWRVIIERGNGDHVQMVVLTEMERIQLGSILSSEPGRPPVTGRIPFVEFVEFVDGERE